MMSVSKTCYQGDGCGLLLSMASATFPYMKVTVCFSVLCKYPDPKGFVCVLLVCGGQSLLSSVSISTVEESLT